MTRDRPFHLNGVAATMTTTLLISPQRATSCRCSRIRRRGDRRRSAAPAAANAAATAPVRALRYLSHRPSSRQTARACAVRWRPAKPTRQRPRCDVRTRCSCLTGRKQRCCVHGDARYVHVCVLCVHAGYFVSADGVATSSRYNLKSCNNVFRVWLSAEKHSCTAHIGVMCV